MSRASSASEARKRARILSSSPGFGNERAIRPSSSPSRRYHVTRGSPRPTLAKSSRCSSTGRERTCEGSRSRSIRLKASARSGAGALSTTITLPPGAATRAISCSTASGSRKWWKAKREVTIEKDASGHGSGSTSPWRQVTFVRPAAAAWVRARSSIAGVMSMPVAWRATLAKAATTRPGPHATSSTVSSGPAPLHSTMRRSAASSRIPGAVANGVAWRVN